LPSRLAGCGGSACALSSIRVPSRLSATQTNFSTYNSQVNAISVSGAPSTSAVTLSIEGEGFVSPGLAGGVCRFTPSATQPPNASTSLSAVTQTLTVVSTTLVTCPTPGTAHRLELPTRSLAAAWPLLGRCRC